MKTTYPVDYARSINEKHDTSHSVENPLFRGRFQSHTLTKNQAKMISNTPTSSAILNDSSIGPHDVLLGRGGATNNHEGNKRYRTLVADHQTDYLQARKLKKVDISRQIVSIVLGRGGRFLKRDSKNEEWVPVTLERAISKTSQALREGLDVRNRRVRPDKQVIRFEDNVRSGEQLQHPQVSLLIRQQQQQTEAGVPVMALSSSSVGSAKEISSTPQNVSPQSVLNLAAKIPSDLQELENLIVYRQQILAQNIHLASLLPPLDSLLQLRGI